MNCACFFLLFFLLLRYVHCSHSSGHASPGSGFKAASLSLLCGSRSIQYRSGDPQAVTRGDPACASSVDSTDRRNQLGFFFLSNWRVIVARNGCGATGSGSRKIQIKIWLALMICRVYEASLSQTEAWRLPSPSLD
jgi:hypothetical protein